MARNRVLVALRAQRRATVRRLATLDDEHWDCRAAIDVDGSGRSPSMRELAAHLILADEAVLSTRALLTRIRRGGDHRWDADEIARRASLSPGELLAALAAHRDRVMRIASTSIAVAGAIPVRGTVGRQPLEQWWCRRVLHEWLHEQDIVEATPLVSERPAPGIAETITTAVLRDLPVAALPRVGLTRGLVRMIIDVSPPAPGDDAPVPDPAPGRVVWGVDFARKHYGSRVAGLPDATVWLHAAGLALLAGGRRGPAELERSHLRVDGDWELALALLDIVCTTPVGAVERLSVR